MLEVLRVVGVLADAAAYGRAMRQELLSGAAQALANAGPAVPALSGPKPEHPSPQPGSLPPLLRRISDEGISDFASGDDLGGDASSGDPPSSSALPGDDASVGPGPSGLSPLPPRHDGSDSGGSSPAPLYSSFSLPLAPRHGPPPHPPAPTARTPSPSPPPLASLPPRGPASQPGHLASPPLLSTPATSPVHQPQTPAQAPSQLPASPLLPSSTELTPTEPPLLASQASPPPPSIPASLRPDFPQPQPQPPVLPPRSSSEPRPAEPATSAPTIAPSPGLPPSPRPPPTSPPPVLPPFGPNPGQPPAQSPTAVPLPPMPLLPPPYSPVLPAPASSPTPGGPPNLPPVLPPSPPARSASTDGPLAPPALGPQEEEPFRLLGCLDSDLPRKSLSTVNGFCKRSCADSLNCNAFVRKPKGGGDTSCSLYYLQTPEKQQAKLVPCSPSAPASDHQLWLKLSAYQRLSFPPPPSLPSIVTTRPAPGTTSTASMIPAPSTLTDPSDLQLTPSAPPPSLESPLQPPPACSPLAPPTAPVVAAPVEQPSPPITPPVGPGAEQAQTLGDLLGVSSWPTSLRRVFAVHFMPPTVLLELLPRNVQEFAVWAQPLFLSILVVSLLLLFCSLCCLWCWLRRLCRPCRKRRKRGGAMDGTGGSYNFDQYSVTISPEFRTGANGTAGSLERFEDASEDWSDRHDAESGVCAAPVKPGSAAKVCSYEEINETNLSDCSAESADFESFENAGHRDVYAASRANKGNGLRHASTRRGAQGIEKRSLLTDMDVLVT